MELVIALIAGWVILVALYSIIFKTNADRAEMKRVARAKRAGGVHWFWFLFWLVFFFPALIVVIIIHVSGRNADLKGA